MKKFQNPGQKDCYELERRKDVSLVFMPSNEQTPYAVVCNLNYERGDWYNGNYFYSLDAALKDFKRWAM